MRQRRNTSPQIISRSHLDYTNALINMAFKLYFSKLFSTGLDAILKSATMRNLVLFTLGLAPTFQNNCVKPKVGDITATSVSSLKPLYSSSVSSNGSDFINLDDPAVDYCSVCQKTARTEIPDNRYHIFLPQKPRCLAPALAWNTKWAFGSSRVRRPKNRAAMAVRWLRPWCISQTRGAERCRMWGYIALQILCAPWIKVTRSRRFTFAIHTNTAS